ncbi:MAG: protein kinase [Verrucomicrobia bacterium]|nr:protein kinase [Verrucomicrobiota bacterium]
MRQIGEYTGLKKLGKGDQGKVYKAFDDNKKQEVAIKVFYTPSEFVKVHPELANTLEAHFEQDGSSKAANSEYKIGRSINRHPAIMKIFKRVEEYSVDGEKVTSLVMEYVDGKHLDQIGDIAYSKKVALQIAREFISALRYSFSKGYLHGDLWSENLYIDRSNHLKLIDLGSYDPLPKLRQGEPSRGLYSTYHRVIMRMLELIIQKGKFREHEKRTLVRSLNEVSKNSPEIQLAQESISQIDKILEQLDDVLLQATGG